MDHPNRPSHSENNDKDFSEVADKFFKGIMERIKKLQQDAEHTAISSSKKQKDNEEKDENAS